MSKQETILKSKVVDHFTLVIDKEDGTPPQEWRLCYDYRAIAKVEDATGLDLKKMADWDKIVASKFFPQVIWGGLNRHNPEVTQDEVLDVLNPDAHKLLADKIFELMFPGFKEAYEAKLAELAAGKDTGVTASPNVPTETPTV